MGGGGRLSRHLLHPSGKLTSPMHARRISQVMTASERAASLTDAAKSAAHCRSSRRYAGALKHSREVILDIISERQGKKEEAILGRYIRVEYTPG